MDVKTSAKKAVLEEIMKLMDEHMSEGLKAKSPKAAVVAVEAEAKPMEEMEAASEDEEKPEMLAEEAASDEMDDEDSERLKKLYEALS